MNDIRKIIDEMNLTPEQMQEFSTTVASNPMAALGLVQKFAISPTAIQQLLQLFMANPQSLMQMASEMGLSSELVGQLAGQAMGTPARPDESKS